MYFTTLLPGWDKGGGRGATLAARLDLAALAISGVGVYRPRKIPMSILALLAATALASTATVTVPAGYYTLVDLASTLADQGVRVQVGASCARDVLAVRLEGIGWPQVRIALEADERLTITQRSDVWRIDRAKADREAEAAQLKRYLDAAAATYHRLLFEVVSKCSEMQALPEAEREVKLDQYTRAPGLTRQDAKVGTLIYLCMSNEVPLAILGAAERIVRPGSPHLFARTVQSDMYSDVGQYVPVSKLRETPRRVESAGLVSDAEAVAFARSVITNARFSIDPVTLAATVKMQGYRPQGDLFLPFARQEIAPSWIEPRLTPTQVFTKPQNDAHDRRLKATDADMESLQTEVELKGPGAMPLSQALLGLAEQSSTNLIYHVSAFTDVVIDIPTRTDLAEILFLARSARWSPTWLEQGVHNRTGLQRSLRLTPALSLAGYFTATRAAGTLVVRDELRFLDSLCSSPVGPPTAWSNLKLQGKRPNLLETSKHISSLPIASWPSALFSSNYLPYCNPIAFKPFAAALVASPKFRLLAENAGDKSVSIAYADLEPPAKTALRTAYLESAVQLDVDGPWGTQIPGFLFDSLASTLTLQVSRKKAELVFLLVMDGEPRLTASLRLGP